jgi:flagellar basal body L-ring protein FlgH
MTRIATGVYALIAAALVLILGGTCWPAGAVELYQPQASLYADPVASKVGDIVIVHLDTSSLQVSAGGQSSTTTNSSLISLITSQGLQTTNNSTTTWQHALTGDMAMRVVAITPEGLFHVQGTRHIEVDGTMQAVTIEGVIRPQDLDATDTVSGSHMADVVATVHGHLNTTQRFGLLDALALIFGAGILLKLLP